MKTFGQFIAETTDNLNRLAASKKEDSYAKQHGFQHTNRSRLETGHHRHMLTGKAQQSGKDIHTGHIEFKHHPSTHHRSDVKTTFTKMREKSPIHQERHTVDQTKHKSVKDAVDHLNKLYKMHE